MKDIAVDIQDIKKNAWYNYVYIENVELMP